MHFEVQTSTEGCEIVDLKSRNGTRVNGRPVDRALLRDGDEIDAGTSKFRLGVSGDNPALASTKMNSRFVDSVTDPQLAAGLQGRLAASFDSKALPSGWWSCRGNAKEVAPAVLAELLTQLGGLFLLYDPNRAQVPVPGDEPRYLFDRQPEAVAKLMSPVFIPTPQVETWKELVKAAWGKDAVVCLYSGLEAGELLSAVRKSCQPDDVNAISGIVWPKVLASVLSSASADAANGTIPGVTAALVESGENPESWLLISRERMDDQLRKFGFKAQLVESPTQPISK
jgi:pSer/pThr/pTyr-binding forkhead associated (FHA) protein